MKKNNRMEQFVNENIKAKQQQTGKQVETKPIVGALRQF